MPVFQQMFAIKFPIAISPIYQLSALQLGTLWYYGRSHHKAKNNIQ